uniref:Uncharacterized protein n=1 Tax=Callorhinchus milii TaxID=7868 RepID=A0A4W3JWS0_CALMI
MNYLSGVSSTQNSIPLVQNVVIENNYSLENEETTTIDMVDAMQLGTNEQLSADKNEAAADPSECEPVENIEKGQDIKKTSNSSHQDDAVKICIPRKSTRRRVNLDRLCFNLHVSQCHNSQPFQYSAERKRKAPSSDCEDLSEKLLNHRKTKRVQNSQHSARDCKNSNVPSLACIEFSQNVQTKKCANVQTKEAQFIKNTKTFMIQPQQGNRKTRAELRKAQNHKKRNRTTFSTGKADEERKKLTGDEAGSKQRSSQFRKIHTRSSSQHSKAKKETSLSCDTQSKARNNRNAENIVGSESSLSSLTASASSSFPFSLAHANRRNLYGETKLHIAVKNRDLNMLRAFIQAGVNVNLPDHAGWTPLHEASLQGFHEIVQELLSAGAEVNCKGDCGVTPLQDAAISGHYQIVQLLLQHGAIAIQNADIGKCAQYVIDGKIKRLIDNQQQKRLEKGITKIGNKQLLRGVDFKNGVDCQKLEVCSSGKERKCKMRVGSYYDFKTPLSLKCKRKITSQRKKYVKPRSNQSKAKHQTLFPTHKRLARHLKAHTPHNSNPQSADKVKIQTNAAFISMDETITGSSDCINCNSQAVLFCAGISDSQKLLRKSTRTRNLSHKCNCQDQNCSIVPIRPRTKVPQQNRLEVRSTAAVNKNSSVIATPNCQQMILRCMSNQLTNSNPENKTAEKIARNTSDCSKIAALKRPNATDNSAQLLKEYQKCSQHSVAKTRSGETSMSKKEATCYLSAAKVVKTCGLRVSRNNVNVEHFRKKTPLAKGTEILPGVNPIDANKSVEHVMSIESNSAVEITTMEILQSDRIKQHKSTGNKILEEGSNCDEANAVVLQDRACCTMTSEYELEQGTQPSVTSKCVLSQQEANCTTALHTDKGDIVITQSETGNDIVPTEDTDETMVFEPVISGHNLKETVTMEHQSNSSMPTCTMISSNKLNATPINLHSESKITVDNSSDTIGELNVNNSHVLSHSSVSTDQEAAEATNSSKAKEGHGSSKNSRSSNFVHSKWREFNHDTSEKDGPSHVAERNQSKEKTLNSTLHESEKIYKVQPAEVTGNMEMASKPSTSQVTSETSGIY